MTIPVADPEALLAALRAQDDAAMTMAYRQIFAGDVGRYVLAHILADAGLGRIRPADLNGRERAWWDGRAAQAMTIRNFAGFGEPETALLVLTGADQLEGRNHDRSSSGFGGPDRDPDLEPD